MTEQHTEDEPKDWEGPAEPLPDGSPAEAEDSQESAEGEV